MAQWGSLRALHETGGAKAMKLVIDKDAGKWRWSLVTIHGMNVKIHGTGTVDGSSLDAFNAGWAEALAKGYVKDVTPPAA